MAATPIDYQTEDFAARIRELTGEGVDVVLDGIGGECPGAPTTCSGKGGRLVLFGHYSTLVRGRRSTRKIVAYYLSGTANLLPDGRRVLIYIYQIAKLRDRHQDWFRQDLSGLFDLLRRGRIAPIIAERLPLTEARRAHERLATAG